MRLLRWEKRLSGSLRGFVDLALIVENGRLLEVYEWAVHVGPNEPWISPPGKAQIDRDGNLIRKLNGCPDHVAVMRRGDRETGDHFSRTVIRLLLEKHPNALGAEETP